MSSSSGDETGWVLVDMDTYCVNPPRDQTEAVNQVVLTVRSFRSRVVATFGSDVQVRVGLPRDGRQLWVAVVFPKSKQETIMQQIGDLPGVLSVSEHSP